MVTPASAAQISGEVTAITGHSLSMDGVEIRLVGVYAPALKADRGPEARDFMDELTAGKVLSCQTETSESYGRVVATCFLEDGRDVAAELVRAGFARDCRRYSRGRYARYETGASRQIELPDYCAP
jgi:endonuclease YncB( thermonuclease family)